MREGSKNYAKAALFHRFSRRESLLLLCIIFGLSTAVLFEPYFSSLWQWHAHKTVDFEGNSISLPKRWISKENGHLLSLRQPGVILLFPYESTITVDPFAERWQPKVKQIGDLFLRMHGKPIDVHMPGAHSMKCASWAPAFQRHNIYIYCLSADSVHSFEFFGERSAISDFAEVSEQALNIASQHPGIIFRK